MPVSRFYSSTAGAMVLQLGVTAVATTLTVDSTVGLPGSTPFTLLVDAGKATEEIVTVLQVSGNSLVVKRGEDGTSAQPHDNGAVIRHALTARDLRESRQHESDVSGVHGTTSAVVGVNDSQALTNKNLTAASNTFPSTLATASGLTAHTAATAAHGATGAVVGTTNAQTLTNKTLASAQFTGNAVNAAGNFAIGDAASTLQPGFFVNKKASTGANAYQASYYISDAGAAGRLAHVLKENGVEVGRTELHEDGSFSVGGNVVTPDADMIVGGSSNVLQRVFRILRKATTGTKTYESLSYLAGGATTDTAYAVNVLKENGTEVARWALQNNGAFRSYGDIVADGTVSANNIWDTGWVSTGFASQPNWSETTSAYRVRNGVCTVNLRFSRSGADLTVGANGGVADDTVTIIPAAARSTFTVTGTGVALTSTGSFGFIYQIRNGVVTIVASTNPSVKWNKGADFYTTISYLI